MQSLEYINPMGERVLLGNARPYILSHIDGTGGADVEIKSTRSPYQDGSTVSGVQLADRLITLTGAVMGPTREEMYELRRKLARVFNPKLGAGRLIYTNDYRSYAATAIPDESPKFTERAANNQLFQASFTCPDPFWHDVLDSERALKYANGGMTFPWRMRSQFTQIGYKGIYRNVGDESAPLLIRYYGPAKNPVITNETTGEFIKVAYELSATDVLEINTAFGRKRVEVVAADGERINVFHWIDLDSTFFQLELGDNMLSYDSDDESDKDVARVEIKWNNRYVGV
ncbi:MAG: phage tail family protein [Cohnella sp.]|nr:phage tail family protein [Cohnella sp.]